MTILCSLSGCHPGRRAKRADPGPKYPGIGNQAEAGVLGSRLSRLTALGRDDKSKGRVICDSPALKGGGKSEPLATKRGPRGESVPLAPPPGLAPLRDRSPGGRPPP